MLERYLTPLFFTYIEKYVKNLAPSDFQLSLWQGDVSLNNLELKLDVVESEFDLPFRLVSGKIRQLRVKVPWTALGSEPVKITVETLECVFKLKERSSDDDESSSSSTTTSKTTTTTPTSSAPPGYVQSWTNKIVNNVQIAFKNVVFKYIEDDVLLSINIQEADVYPTDRNWTRAFVDVSRSDETRRQVCDVQNLTACLDKRDSAGKILCYQQPLLYKCCFQARLLYNNNSSDSNLSCPEIRSGNTFDVLIKQFNLALSDFQLPMFVRLVERIIALYYGSNLDGSGMPVYLPNVAHVKEKTTMMTKSGDEEKQGWTSWALSLVTADDAQKSASVSRSPVFTCFGLYVNRATFLYKMMETLPSSRLMLYSNYAFRPVMLLDLFDVAMVTNKSDHFFDYTLGVAGAASRLVPETMAYAKLDVIESNCEDVFFSCGRADSHATDHLRGSLFYLNPDVGTSVGTSVDTVPPSPYAPHSLSTRAATFKAVWFQYRNTSPPPPKPPDGNASRREWLLHPNREATEQLVRFGRLRLTLTQATRRFFVDFVQTGSNWNPNVEPRRDSVQELTREAARCLRKEYVDGGYDFDLMASLGVCMKSIRLICAGADVTLASAVPKGGSELNLKVKQLDVVAWKPFYPDQLTIGCPDVLHDAQVPDHCYFISNYKVEGIQIALQSLGEEHALLSCPSVEMMTKTAVVPKSWIAKHNVIMERTISVNSLSLQATSSQCLLAVHHVSKLMTGVTSELDVIEPKSGSGYLHANVSDALLRVSSSLSCHSKSAEIGSVGLVISKSTDHYVPVLFGPLSTENVSTDVDYSLPSSALKKGNEKSLFSFEIQQLFNETGELDSSAASTLVFEMEGMAVNVDHQLYSWILMLLREIEPEHLPNLSVPKSVERVDSGTVESMSSIGESQTGSALAVKNRSQRYLSLWNRLSKLNIKLKVAPLAVFLPSSDCLSGTTSLSDDLIRDIPSFYRRALESSSFPSTFVVCLPELHVTSHQFQQRVSHPMSDSTTLPWTVRCRNLSVYSLEQRQCLFLIRPFSFDVTLASSPVSGDGGAVPTFSHSPLSLCGHITSSAPTVELSRKQIELMLRVASSAFCCFSLAASLYSSPPKTDNAANQVGFLDSEQRFRASTRDDPVLWSSDFHSPQASQIGGGVNDENQRESLLDLFQFWFQLALPKLTVNIYGRNLSETTSPRPPVCLVRLEVEDVAASVDVSSASANGKFSLGGMSIKHFKKTQNHVWGPGSNGGVLLAASSSSSRESLSSPVVKDRPHYRNAVLLSFQHRFEKSRSKSKSTRRSTPPTKVSGTVVPLRIVLCATPVYVIGNVLGGHHLFGGRRDDSRIPERDVKSSRELPDLNFTLDELEAVFAASNDDDVLLVGVTGILVKPHPLNPIPRPVASEDQDLGSLTTEHAIEDGQLQLTVQSVGLWTAKWSDLLPAFSSADVPDSNALLSEEEPSQNPALQWNLSAGDYVSRQLNLIPLVERVELQCVVAPAISSIIRTEKKSHSVHFGHSVEITCKSGLDMSINDGQLKLLSSLAENYQQLIGSSSSSSSPPQKVQTAIVPVDVLVSTSRLAASIYYRRDSESESSTWFCPLLRFCLAEVLLRVKRSNSSTLFDLNCFDCRLNASLDKAARKSFAENVKDDALYPFSVIGTRSGKRNASGVSPSLIVASVTLLADEGIADLSLAIDKPLKVKLNATLCNEILGYFDHIFEAETSDAPPPSTSEQNVDDKKDGIGLRRIRFSSSQCVLLLESQVEDDARVVVALTESQFDLHPAKDANDGLAVVSGLLVKTYWSGLRNYLLLPLDLNASIGCSRTGVISSRLALTPVELNVGTADVMLVKALTGGEFEKIRTRFGAGTLDVKSKKSNALSWESADDFRSFPFRLMSSSPGDGSQQRPLSGEIVVTSDGLSRFPLSVAWTYSESRSLRRLKLAMEIAEDSPYVCCLYYWDEFHQRYAPSREFSLPEDQDIDLSSKPFVASEWKLKFIPTFPAISDDASPKGLSSEDAIKCIEIHSYYDPSAVPCICAEVFIPRLKLNVTDILSTSRTFSIEGVPYEIAPSTSSKLRQFKVMSLCVKDWNFSCSRALRCASDRLQSKCDVEIHYVDFTTNETRIVAEILDLHVDFQNWRTFVDENEMTEVSLTTNGCYLTLAHSSIDAATKLNRTLRKWFRDETDDFRPPANCLICNDSVDVLEVKQSDSHRRPVRLERRCVTELAWDSTLPHLLSVSLVAEGDCAEGEPFSVEKSTRFECHFVTKVEEDRVFYADVNFKGLSTVVMLTGGVSLRNFLLFNLEVSAISDDSKRLISLLPGKPAETFPLMTTTSEVELIVRQVASSGDNLTPLSNWSSPVRISIGEKEKSFSSILTFAVPLNDGMSGNHSIGCFVVRENKALRFQITFVPLCRVRNLFPEPLLLQLEAGESPSRYAVPGRGVPFDVPFIQPETKYSLSCLINGAEKPSTRTASMVVTGHGLPAEDCFEWIRNGTMPNSTWPYLNVFEKKEKSTATKGSMRRQLLSCFVRFGDHQLSVDVTVLFQTSPCCWTLTFQPLGLFTNSTGRPLLLHHKSLKCAQAISPGQTVSAICKLPFRIGLNMGTRDGAEDDCFWSDVLESLLLTEVARTVVLYPDSLQTGLSYQHVPIKVNNDCQVSHLLVSRAVRNDLTMVVISDAVSVCNASSVSLSMISFLGNPRTLQTDHLSSFHPTLLLAKSDQFQPLLVSDVKSQKSSLKSLPSLTFAEALQDDSVLVACASLWSVPFYLRQPAIRRLSFSVPSRRRDAAFHSLSASFYYNQGHYYITITDDPSPRLVVSNATSIIVSVAQGLPSKFRKDFPDVEVVEDIAAQRLGLLSIQPNTSAVYEFPTWTTSYTCKPSPDHDVYLCFRIEKETPAAWSCPIFVSDTRDVYEEESGVNVPSFGDVTLKTFRSKRGMEITVVERSVSRLTSSSDVNRRPVARKLEILGSVKHLALRLCKDTQASLARELILLTVEKIGFGFRPFEVDGSSHLLKIDVGSAQLDNRATDMIDFPVVLYPYSASIKAKKPSQRRRTPASLIQIEVLFDTAANCTAFVPTSFKLQVDSLVLLLEDKFLYPTLDLLRSYGETARGGDSDFAVENAPSFLRPLPQAICSVPVALHEIELCPFTAYVSLKASVKVFLSSDQTNLSFEGLKISPVYSQSTILTETIVQHYVSMTLSKGGWLLGSLDLLGSPASLLRNVGSGVKDLILLPYDGLTRGPKSFVTGLGRGVAACLRQVSTGTLSSVVNVASSVSRNLELMSLDRAHVEVQERMRRQPRNVASGLRGVGLSLLGAVAGLVDQPVRSLESTTKGDVSPVEAAGSLASGIGKGLIGAVTKPVGAAFELISVTGKGLMQATGLGDFPARKSAISERWWKKSSLLCSDVRPPDEIEIGDVVLALRGEFVDQEVGDVCIFVCEERIWLSCESDRARSYPIHDISLKSKGKERIVELVYEPRVEDVSGADDELSVAVKVERFLSSVPGAYGYEKSEKVPNVGVDRKKEEYGVSSFSIRLQDEKDMQQLETTLRSILTEGDTCS